MKRNLLPILLFFPLFFSLLGFTNLNTNPEQPLLIQVEIKTTNDLLRLSELPVAVYLRTDDYVIATIESDNLSFLEDTGINFKILDKDAWSEPYFLISQKRRLPLKDLPPIGETVLQTMDEIIVKAPIDATYDIRKAGFQIARLPDQSIPLQASSRKTLQDFKIDNLQHPIIGAIIQQVSDSFIRAGVQRLEDFQTRHSATDSVYAAGQWIYDQFKSYGYEDVKFDTLAELVAGRLQRNVIATKRGTTYPDSVIVIGGHYDSVVYDGTDTRVYAPGADDNATGTVAALEAARILADIDLEATVIFAAWAAEEQGLFGGWDFARKAFNKNMNIGGYLNFDMIGNLIEQDPLRDVTFYINSASQGLAELMQEMAFLYTTLEPRFATASGGSDHWPFLQMGFHAVGVEEGDFSPHWHLRSDVIENVNIPYTNEVIRMGLATLLHLAGPPKEIGGPYITFSSLKFDDDKSGKSVGNGNHFLDPGETIELGVSLMNAGSIVSTGVTAVLKSDDPYITILDNSKFYGDIVPGDSAAISDQFLFTISSQTPANRSIVFSLDVTDSQGHLWTSRFLFKIIQPLLVYNNYRISELAGDGDQIPDVGETCNIHLSLGNYGSRPANDVRATLSTYDPDIAILDNQASIQQILMDSVAGNSNDPFVIQIKATALPHKVKFKLNIEEGAGYYTTATEFNILLEQGRVLLVMDDGNANRSIYYSEILEDFGVPTDSWHVASQGPVPQQTIVQHKNIIWFTGTEAINTLTANDQASLKIFLDNGGNLFLSGQMLGFNIKDSEFFKNYIQTKFVNLRTGLHHLQSTPQNVVTTLDSVAVASSGSALQTFTSESDPISPAFAIYTYNTKTSEGAGNIRSSGTAMHAVDNGTFKLIYCGFGFEGFVPGEARRTILSDILSWFKGSPLDTRAILSVADFSIDDDSINPSQGDGDRYINPGETIELHVNLKNTGSLAAKDVTASLRSNNSYITILDSTLSFGEIARSSSTTTTDAFTFLVNNSAPHQSPIHFDLIITDSTGNRWDETLAATIYLSNTITGHICDAMTKVGIEGAQLFWNGPINDTGGVIQQGEVSADSSGQYIFSAPIGVYAFRAWSPGYAISDLILVELPPDTTINFELTSPQLAVTPESITISLNVGETYADTMSIGNSRSGQLFYTLLETSPGPLNMMTSTKFDRSKGLSWNFEGIDGIKNHASVLSNYENSIAPDPAQWKLMHIDPDEPEVDLDIHECFIQNDANDIFFKITAHQKWGNPAIDFIYAIFMDTDLNVATGAQINDIGADYLIALGNIGNLILSWTGNGWNPIPGNSSPHYLLLSASSDSLEVGIHLNQIRNPARISLVNSFISTTQAAGDVAPDNGLFHIPYCMFDASWLTESSVFGTVLAGSSADIILKFDSKGLAPGSFQTNLEIVNNQPDGESKIIPVRLNVGGTSVADGAENELPTEYVLHPNSPNPFNPETMIKYQIPEAGPVKLEIYNLMGQRIRTLVHEVKKAGFYQARWNGKIETGQSASSGVYFYRLEAGNFIAVKKMLLIQ